METKKCPYCGGEIMFAAKKCKHCGEWLNDNSTDKNSTGGVTKDVSNVKNSLNKKNVVLAGLVLLIIGLSVGGWAIIKHNQKKDWEDMMNGEYAVEIDSVEMIVNEIMENIDTVFEPQTSLQLDYSNQKYYFRDDSRTDADAPNSNANVWQ